MTGNSPTPTRPAPAPGASAAPPVAEPRGGDRTQAEAAPGQRRCPLADDPQRMDTLRSDDQVRHLLQLLFAATRG